MIDLSNREREVMEIFWREKRELTVSELGKMSPNGTLKLNSIYLYINSLLKKGAIRVSGFVPAVRTHARTYRAMFTEADYISMQITGQISSRANSENLKQIILTAIQSGSISKEALDELQELIDQQRGELKK